MMIYNFFLRARLFIMKVRIAFLEGQIRILRNERLNKKTSFSLDKMGFWQCDRCTHHYMYFSMTELENLIDRHMCKTVKKQF